MNRRQLADENYRLVRANNELADKARKLELEKQEILLQTSQQIDAISTRNRAADIRLAVLQSSGYSSIDDLHERATWVLTAAVPAKTEQDEKLVDFPGKSEMAEPDYRGIGEHLLEELWEEIEVRLATLRRDSNIRAGRDRIQKLHTRLVNILRSADAQFGLPERITR